MEYHRHLLSSQGSDRATAYGSANKIVTLKGKTHAVWTDAIARTMGRTFDHTTGRWGESVFIGEGCDNHNSPSLAADRQGRLHIAYGPHGQWDILGRAPNWPSGQFRHAVANEAGSFSGLEKTTGAFGYSATYACLLHGTDDLDCIAYRGGDHPPGVMFQKQRLQGGWTKARCLFAQDIAPGYTHYLATLAGGSDGVLYLGAHFYARERECSLGVAALRSDDQGVSWTDLQSHPIALPAEYEERLAIPHPEPASDPRLGGMAVDRHGRLWAFTHPFSAGDFPAYACCWTPGGWRSTEVTRFLTPGRYCFEGVITVDARDRIHIFVAAAERAAVKPGESLFGHPTLEVFHLLSEDDGATFSCRQVSEANPGRASWHPTITRGGPFHPVDMPALLYTSGNGQPNGPDRCRHTVLCDVICVTLCG